MSRLDLIRIKNAQFYAYHGAELEEQSLGGKFEVDIELRCDLSIAEEKDSLKQTVDYEKVYALLQKIVTEKKYYLIEALANRIAKEILWQFDNVHQICVRIRKPHPPVKGVVDFVEVEISQSRS
jgi:dihydroneopterin aldolase